MARSAKARAPWAAWAAETEPLVFSTGYLPSWAAR